MNINLKRQFDCLNSLIGNTPLVKITYEYKSDIKNLYAKLEWFNLSGSVKDRIALEILKNAYKNGEIKQGQKIVEVTSGNTGISFACLGAYLDNPVTIYMPDNMSNERKKLLKLYGANLVLVSKENGGFLKCLELAEKELLAFKPRQFENKINVYAHFNTTAKEIIEKIKNYNIDAFISGVGTGGTLVGIGKALKQYKPEIKIIALQPKSSPILTNGKKCGKHLIEGISDDFIPKIYDKNLVDYIVDVSNEDAILMAQKLSKIGLGAGISSGANFVGAVLSGENNVVTVFADDSKKYLSTSLGKKVKNANIAENIKIHGYEIVL